MLVRINAASAGQGWTVTFTDEKGAPLSAQPGGQQLAPRLLGALAADGQFFPLPPPGDPPPPGTPAAQLLADSAELRACFGRILAQQPGQAVAERFGNYLFHTLIGSAAWQAILAAAAGQPFELALCWDAGDSSLARLPWEMLACSAQGAPGETTFLAAMTPQVAITRRVPGQTTLPPQLQSPPRVLFVVGTGLTEQAIRPGAEYLGLLRALETNNLRLQHQLLAHASPERLKAAIAAFEPSILHVICHGGVSAIGGRPYLELQSDEAEGKTKEVYAEDLLAILAAGPPIEAVVLNACYTASVNDYLAVGQVALPLAVELVRGDGARGVPIVVGMAGEVGDRACRLFTRRFYEALLSGGSIAQAAAQGRRLGLTNPHSEEWRSSLDWALPTMFLPVSAGEATLAVVPDPGESERQQMAQRFRQGAYPVFCGREEHFDAYAALMGDDRLQRLSRPASGQRLLSGWGASSTFTALAIGAQYTRIYNEDDQGEPRLGLTRLLGELAATAFRDGHLPIFFSISKKDDPRPYVAPKDPAELLLKLAQAAQISAERLGLCDLTCWRDLNECLQWQPNDPRPAVLGLPAIANRVFANSKPKPNDLDVLAAVFWMGARELLKAVRQDAREPARVRLLLIVDDVERLEMKAAAFLLQELLKHDVLGATWFRDGMRAIVGYTVRGEEPGKSVYKDVIQPWNDSSLIFSIPLNEFGEFEGFRAYRQFLFDWQNRTMRGIDPQPLTFSQRRYEEVETLLRSFHEDAALGVPSWLTASGMRSMVLHLIRRKELIEAYDDALISGQAPARRTP